MDVINEAVSLAEGIMTVQQLQRWQSKPDKAKPSSKSQEEEEEEEEWVSKDARVICSPKQAYFNRSLAVYYSAKSEKKSEQAAQCYDWLIRMAL